MLEEMDRRRRLPINGKLKEQKRIVVEAVIRTMRGGSQSNLVRCDDGKLYVLKLSNNPQGPNVLANEFLGSYLLNALGLSCPTTREILVSDDMLADRPSLAFETRSHVLLPQGGIHCGSEFLGTTGYQIYDWIPPSRHCTVINPHEFFTIYVFDIWTSHQDQRQCIYRQEEENGSIQAFFIDNGHLFGGPSWASLNKPCRSLAIRQVVEHLGRDGLIESSISHIRKEGARIIAEGIHSVPHEWYSGDLSRIERELRGRLASLHELVERHFGSTAKVSEKITDRNAKLPSLYRDRIVRDGTLGRGNSLAPTCPKQ